MKSKAIAVKSIPGMAENRAKGRQLCGHSLVRVRDTVLLLVTTALLRYSRKASPSGQRSERRLYIGVEHLRARLQN